MKKSWIDVEKVRTEVQNRCYEMLEATVKICEQHKITYFLVGGSALGAYRHEGFIPWDDDIDIAIPRNQYEEFKLLCNELLDSKYYVQNFVQSQQYAFPYTKIRLKNSAYVEKGTEHLNIHHGMFIDIFPLDNIPNNLFLRNYQKYGLKISNLIRIAKLNMEVESPKKKWIMQLVKCAVPTKIVPILYKHFLLIANKKETKSFGVLVGAYNYEKESFDKEIFGEGKMLEFEGFECRVPQKIEQYLTGLYGESFMQLPPIGQRKTHNPLYISFEQEYVPGDVEL